MELCKWYWVDGNKCVVLGVGTKYWVDGNKYKVWYIVLGVPYKVDGTG